MFNFRKNNSGQVQFGEAIGVIMIVYIVLVVGFVWYNNSNSKAIAEEMAKQQKEKAFERYDYILKLNLIHKSELGYIDQEFDKTSLEAMGNYSQTVEGKEFFRQKLGTSKIEFQLYDIDLNSIKNITVYNNTPTDEFGGSDVEFKQSAYKTLVPVYDGVDKTSYLGVLEVLDFQVIR